MELLLAALFVSAVVCAVPKVIVDAVVAAKAASAGQWDFLDKERSRRAARRERWAKAWADRRARRNRQAGGDGQYRPGARAYLGDLYHGFWERRIHVAQTKRAARPDFDPSQPTWRDHVAAYARRRRGRRGADAPTLEPEVTTEPERPSEATKPDEPTPPPAATEPAGPPIVDRTADPLSLNPRMNEGGNTMPELTANSVAPAAEEVTTNEALRRNFKGMADAAVGLADALADAETYRNRIKALADASRDGVDATRFDKGATAAAHEVADNIDQATLTEWAGLADAVEGAANQGVQALDKWLDSESQIADEDIDPKVLAATAS